MTTLDTSTLVLSEGHYQVWVWSSQVEGGNYPDRLADFSPEIASLSHTGLLPSLKSHHKDTEKVSGSRMGALPLLLRLHHLPLSWIVWKVCDPLFIPSFISVVLKVGSSGQHYSGTYKKCTFSGSTPDLPKLRAGSRICGLVSSLLLKLEYSHPPKLSSDRVSPV